METASAPTLFDSAFLAKLEQLYLLSKKLFRGDHRAERKSRQIGSSLEFADYRNYTEGDDLRSVDWNIYGRLDRLFVKLFEHEQDLHIYFLIDASASMRWAADPVAATTRLQARAGDIDRGSSPPQESKFDSARRIAASLAYIGLANMDRVNVHWFDSQLRSDVGMCRGKSQFHSVLSFLESPPEPRGATELLASFRAFTHRFKRRGLVFVISDFFDPEGYEEAAALLRHSRFDVHLLQVLAPEELRPHQKGDLRLVESEGAGILEVTANDALLRRYHDEIDSFIDGLAAYCRERGIGYAQVSTAAPFQDTVLRVLRDGRMIK